MLISLTGSGSCEFYNTRCIIILINKTIVANNRLAVPSLVWTFDTGKSNQHTGKDNEREQVFYIKQRERE